MTKLTIENGRLRVEAISSLRFQALSGVNNMNEDARKSFFDEEEMKSGRIKKREFLEDQ